MWHRWIFAVCMYVCTQDGRFNCLQCAARYGRTELFHHLVQRYGCDPKEKDCYNGVSSACIRLCVWRGVGGTVGSRVIYNIICTICHGCRQVVAGLPFTPPVTMVTKHWQEIWFPNTDWTPMNQRMWVYHSWSICVVQCDALYSPLIAVGITYFCTVLLLFCSEWCHCYSPGYPEGTHRSGSGPPGKIWCKLASSKKWIGMLKAYTSSACSDS